MSILPPIISERCCDLGLLVSPQLSEALSEAIQEQAKAYGPGLSGALFGAAWWFWIDACVASGVHVPFLHFLPGVVATLALLMINCIRREDLQEEYDSFDEGVFCRSRSWLLLSYIISTASIVLSVWVFLKFYALNPEATTIWPGVTVIFQTTLILGSALLFFLGRTPISDGTSSGGYGGF